MKKNKTILILALLLTLLMSISVCAGELDKNEKYVLEELRDDNFPEEMKDEYINQLENYMYQDNVELTEEGSRNFVKYLKDALTDKESFENHGKTFRKFSSMYINFQKAGEILDLVLEYDSAQNRFYAIYNEGYDVRIAIDTAGIVKATDKSETKSSSDTGENKSDSIVKIIFAIVILLCCFGIVFNLRKWNRTLRQRSLRAYDDEEEDQLEVAERKRINDRIHKTFYANAGQLIRYFYIPIIMGVLLVILSYLAITPLQDLNNSIKNNFINRQPIVINKSAKEFTPYKKKSQKDSLSINKIVMPKFSEQYGVLENKDLKIDTPVFFGDRPEELEEGAGTYLGSYLPGFGKTILIGAHDTTYFKGLENVAIDDEFTFTTTYGIYKYRVSKINILSDQFEDAFDLNADKEELVLYTCYPFGALNGKKTQRMFVHLEPVSGPIIKR